MPGLVISVFGIYIIGAYFFKGKVPEGLEWKKERNLFFRPYGDGQFLYYSTLSSRPYIVPNDEVRMQIEQKHKFNNKFMFYVFMLMMFLMIFFWSSINGNELMLIGVLVITTLVISVISKLIMRPVLKSLPRAERKPPYFERLQEVSDHYSYRHLFVQLFIISMICISPLILITQGVATHFNVILFICILPAVVSYMIMIAVKSRSIFKR